MRELIYSEIKHHTMTCEFRPGEPLNEAQLGTLLGLGRTPIRQVLCRSEVEGLVQILPRKSMLVMPLLFNDVLNMIEMCVTNEILCVTLAVECAHPVDFDAMRAIVDVSPALIEHRDIVALATLDFKFRLAISAALHNYVLAELLRGLHEKQARFWFLLLPGPQHLWNVYDEYLAVPDALGRYDAPAAREAVYEHTDEFRRTIVRML